MYERDPYTIYIYTEEGKKVTENRYFSSIQYIVYTLHGSFLRKISDGQHNNNAHIVHYKHITIL